MSMGIFPESLSQAILVGIMLVGRLGVVPPRHHQRDDAAEDAERRQPPAEERAAANYDDYVYVNMIVNMIIIMNIMNSMILFIV